MDRTVDKIAHWVHWVVVGKGQDKAKQNGNGNDNDQGNHQGNGKGVGGGPGNSADIQLWTVSDGPGFQVLQFAKSFTAQHKDLFENTVTTEIACSKAGKAQSKIRATGPASYERLRLDN